MQGAQAFVVIVTQPGTADRRVHEFAGEIVVGRSEECDIVLSSPVVSRRHALIAWTGGQFRVHDLGSRNATILDGARFHDGEREAPAGAIVQIGPFHLALAPVEVSSNDTTALATALNSRCYLDAGARTFFVDGAVAISGVAGREYALLERLGKEIPNVVPNVQLGDAIWGAGQWDVYMLHNLVRRVRRKIGAKTDDEVLVTVPGAGYRLL